MIAPFAEDQRHKDNMIQGSKDLLDAIREGHARNRTLRWSHSVIGNAWEPTDDPNDDKSQRYYRAMRSLADKEMAETRRVSRDPCPCCNVRADIGCKHRRLA